MARLLLLLASAAVAVHSTTEVCAARQPESGPVYLVYAGPYSASPSSAFGHLFLAMAGSIDQPPPLWDVITFNAETFGVDPLRYLTVGIKGGFLGRYSRVQFHEKTREYGVIADRDLWMIEVRLSPEERSRLDQLLADAEDDWFPYTFFVRNCAYYLQALLAEATGAVPPPSGVTSPTGVLSAVQDSRIGGPALFRPAASRRLLQVSRQLSSATAGQLESRSWREVAADTAWHRQLNGFDRRFVLEFLSLRMEGTSSPLPALAEVGLESLRAAIASDGGKEGTAYPTDVQEPIPSPRFHGYTRLRASQGTDRVGSARTYLQIRGALHDESDPWYGHRPITSLDLLSLEASSPTTSFRPRIESAVLFSQRALAPGDWVRPRASWLLEVHALRGGVFSDDGLHLALRGGSGGTWRLPLALYSYALLTTGVVGDWGAGVDFAPGFELGLLALPHRAARLGARLSHERRLTAWSAHFSRLTTWVKIDLGADWGLLFQWQRAGVGNSWAAALDWFM